MNTPTVLNLQDNLGLESLLHRITNRILQSLELQDILAATVTEVRVFLNTDRVMIYKFHEGGSGQVMAEAIYDKRLPSLLGLNFPADDIPPHARELFVKARARSIVDVHSRQISQSFLRDPETGAVSSEDMHYRAVDGCHIEYLTAMGVESSLVVPILHYDQLWGLLVSHHSEPWSVSEQELQAVQMVVDQIAVAIAQATLLAQAREKAHWEATVNYIATSLRSQSAIDLQTALKETVTALQGIGGRLYIRPTNFEVQNASVGHLVQFREATSNVVQLYTCGVQPVLPEEADFQQIEQSQSWRTYLESNEAPAWAVSDLYQVPELQPLQAAFLPTSIRGMLVVSLQYGQRCLGYLSVFRDAIDTETLWAGQFDSDQRQIRARQSFEAWRESKHGQAPTWTRSEIDLAQALASHFAAAILHHEIHWQLQTLNSNLEHQVHERTAKLQQATEQQQALLEVVTKIRESLITPEGIFQTATREVCNLLNTERVAVYRFNADWGGEFVHTFESTCPEWQDVMRLGENMVWDDTYLQVTQGGRYRNNETFAVDDIHWAGLYHCHVEILEQFQIKAFAIAPIFLGQNLWGLLAAYQHSTPRHWEDSEVKFLAQTAAQLGMALQQAELITQTQQQSAQLSQALNDLRKTQTQLIQNEKISSLGQLVAGIAHEINNPVNFIYGNLSHAREYAEEILNLLQLYQQAQPDPSPQVREQLEAIDFSFIAEDLPKILTSMKVGADRIRQIILSLLNFSRLDQAELKSVNVHEGIESTLLILQHRLKAKPDSPAIEVVKEYGDLPQVECYPGQLNQVFMNVLNNAIDAIEHYRQQTSEPRAGKIAIHTAATQESDRPGVMIRIVDNGSGIPENVKARILDPFFTTKPVGKGTGLGLSISYQIIVDKHSGRLNFTSEPGQGTEFLIEIPTEQ